MYSEAFYCLMNYYPTEICHLLISGVGEKIASEDKTYHDLCYTSSGALAGTRNSSVDPP